MKRSVALTLVALLVLGTTAFGQGIRIEKKVEKKKVAAPAPEVVEQEIEIELEEIAVPASPCGEAKKGGCDGCEKKTAVAMKGAVAISGDWNKLPPEMKERILKELRARYDDETLKQILKSLAAGKTASIGVDARGIGGGKGGGFTVIRKPAQVKGRMVVAQSGEKVIVLEGDPKVGVRGRIVLKDGEEDVGAVIEDLKRIRVRIQKAKNAGDLEKVAEELRKARVRVESSRKVVTDLAGRRHMLVTPKVGGQAHGIVLGGELPEHVRQLLLRGHTRAPAPPAGCRHCSPRPAPRCGCQGHAGRGHGYGPIPQPPRHAGYDDGLRHSLDALRGEISGLRHELRAMRAMHQAGMGKAAMGRPAVGRVGSFKKSGTASGTYRVAMKRPPSPSKPGTPSKVVVVGKGATGGAFGAPKKYTASKKYAATKAGGISFGVVPAKPDPRQKKLENEVASLKKEMGHMKAMMHEMLKKLDDIQKSGKK